MFIRLKDYHTDETVLVNVNHIVTIKKTGDLTAGIAELILTHALEKQLLVYGTVDSIQKQINDASN